MPHDKLFEVEDSVLKTVAESFDKTEETLLEDVIELEEWMQRQPHLPEVLDRKKLQSILLLNKCNLDKTKSKLEMYYTIRTELPCIFEYINPKHEIMKKAWEASYLLPLPKLTDNLYRVYVFKMRDKDALNDMHPYHITGQLLDLTEIAFSEDVSLGDILITDYKNMPLRLFLKVTPRVLYNVLFKVLQKAYSSRVKAIYAFNAPVILEKIIEFAKRFMKLKIAQRIHVCKDESILTKVFPKKILPKDFGGEEKSLEELQEMVKAKLSEYQPRFDQLDQLHVDESLRP